MQKSFLEKIDAKISERKMMLFVSDVQKSKTQELCPVEV